MKVNTRRWELGIPHNPASEWLAKKIAEIDINNYHDYFCFKIGGDGDNGETLMYILDDIFDNSDSRNEFLEKI